MVGDETGKKMASIRSAEPGRDQKRNDTLQRTVLRTKHSRIICTRVGATSARDGTYDYSPAGLP